MGDVNIFIVGTSLEIKESIETLKQGIRDLVNEWPKMRGGISNDPAATLPTTKNQKMSEARKRWWADKKREPKNGV